MKKFNLDGHGVMQYSSNDVRKDLKYFCKRGGGGRSAMVWGAIGFKGAVDIVGIENTMESAYETDVLQNP